MAYRDDVLGDDVLGDSYYGGGGMNVVGAEEVQAAQAVLARAAAQGQPAGARVVRIPGRRPEWRDRLAPGVPMPGTKLYPLALTPLAGGGIFIPALTAIQFTARPQKPFRGERLIAIVRPSAGATAIVLGEIFVGTDLVQATAGGIPLDTFAPNAFGVRMAWPQSEPGIEVRVNCTLQGVLGAGESINVSLVVLGETEA